MTEINLPPHDPEPPDRPMPDHVRKPNHLDKRYYKQVDGKTVFNDKRWKSDNAFYQKWLEQKSNE